MSIENKSELITKPLILLIEDDPTDIMFLRSAFADSEIECDFEIANDGTAALELLFQGKRLKPNMILLDINLPKISGKEVLTKIKEDKYLRNIPTLMLSGSSSALDIEESLTKEADGYIVKPSTLGEYGKTVKIIEETLLDAMHEPDMAYNKHTGEAIEHEIKESTLTLSLLHQSINKDNAEACKTSTLAIIDKISEDKLNNIIIDLENIKSIDTLGFNYILFMHKTAKKLNCSFKIAEVIPALMRRMSIFSLLNATVEPKNDS